MIHMRIVLYFFYLITMTSPYLVAVAQQENLEVVVEGISGALRENVEAGLRIKRLADENRPLPAETRLRWLDEQAGQDIRLALQPFGYYEPVISGELTRVAGGWRAVYKIDPGKPVRIDSVDVQILSAGSNDPVFQELLTNLPFEKGQILQHQPYQELKQTLGAIAAERGYFEARFQRSEIAIDLVSQTAAITLYFDTGERYRYGEIVFEQDTFAPEFLNRFLSIKPGDPYDAKTLLQFQADLIASDYFSEVLVSAAPDRAVNRIIPVVITLTPRKQSQYRFGLGYGTDTGVRGRAGLDRRWSNQWGHRYEIEALASEIQYSIAAKYEIPGLDPRTDSYGVSTQIRREDSDEKDTLVARIGGFKLYQDGPWLKTLALDYHWENFTISGEDKTSRLLIPRIHWARVDTKDRLIVENGSRFSFEIKGGADFLLSDVSFVQALVSSKWIKSLGEKSRFITRADLGTTLIDDSDFSALPTSLRFFAGGDNSVRGYSLDSIGPRDSSDDVIGGKHLLVGSIEYEYEVRERWSVALFVDGGDAFDDSPDFKTGIGVGLRWRSPVGPVRIDIAHGLDDPGDSFRLHLTVGPDL